MTKILGEFGMTEQAVRAAISRMMKTGWLESKKVGNRSYYSMTPRGLNRLNEAAGRIYKYESGMWNKKWCITSYSIPEKQRHLRDEFRNELNYLGFGMLTNSTWISPNQLFDRVKEIAETHDITQFVEVFYAEHLGWSDPKELVEKCWNIEAINQSYFEFIDYFKPRYEALVQRIQRKEPIDDSHCFVEDTQLVHQYRKFLFIDPDFPEDLLPVKWLGTEADKLFKDYNDLLYDGAIRFFESVYEHSGSN